MELGPSLPHLDAPHDSLRFGLPTLKDDSQPSHPVERILQTTSANQARTKRDLLERIYGSAFPMKMDIEHQILNRNLRLPGLPSSRISLHSMTGALDDFAFEDYLGDPRDSEYGSQLDLHTQMEVRLGLTNGPLLSRATP